MKKWKIEMKINLETEMVLPKDATAKEIAEKAEELAEEYEQIKGVTVTRIKGKRID